MRQGISYKIYPSFVGKIEISLLHSETYDAFRDAAAAETAAASHPGKYCCRGFSPL